MGVSAGRGISPPTPWPPRTPNAHKDIKVARGNIVPWGVVGVEEGSTPPPPPQASPGGVNYASATRSAARGSQPGAVRVVAAAGCAKAGPRRYRPQLMPCARCCLQRRRCNHTAFTTVSPVT